LVEDDDGDSALGAVAESSPCALDDEAGGSVTVRPTAAAVLETGDEDRLDELDSMEEANDTESSLSL